MKAKTDLYCPKCGDKVYKEGDQMMSLFFTRSEECCSRCDTMLKRRSPGGQSDTWNFVTLMEMNKCSTCGCPMEEMTVKDVKTNEISERLYCPKCFSLWRKPQSFASKVE